VRSSSTTITALEGVMLTAGNRRVGNLNATDTFVNRHIGPRDEDLAAMLDTLGLSSLDELVERVVPARIRMAGEMGLGRGKAERDVIADLQRLAGQNDVCRSYIGMGYSNCVTPPVILRNILEDPGWYTQYTPYQAEISQGRLEALLTFQTMVIDLTGLEVANASLLDEATAAAEAMTLCRREVLRKKPDATTFFVSEDCHPQTIAVLQTRAEPLGIRVAVGNHETFAFGPDVFGALVQYPTTHGRIVDYTSLCARVHAGGALAVIAADILALTLLKPPGEMGADIAVGSTQRFGVPLGYGGPHAAYMATREAFKRQIPGRIVGLSKDAHGRPALRLALQTREQHIRREKATSNICTSQVLLAITAAMYAVYHGPSGLQRIASRVHSLTHILAGGLEESGHRIVHREYFDTLRVTPAAGAASAIQTKAAAHRINLRPYPNGDLGIALDQTTTAEDVRDLVDVFGGNRGLFDPEEHIRAVDPSVPDALRRTSTFLTHPVFHRHQSETEMLRYLHRLRARDLSLTTSMIPLGSCTMKLNATAEMLALTWPGFGAVHPFAPAEQTKGYQTLFERLEWFLREITGFDAVSLQPNSGAQGEYTGLLVIRAHHRARGHEHRNVCLIPASAHGTNPASASMVGMDVVVVRCDEDGNIDVDDLRAQAERHADRLAAAMITYPSTHGVFEESIKDICEIVHRFGGQVYLDGANMNALVGLARPAELGADVCHLNLHKTFCIPHGGGGPGMGPIGVAAHLAPFLPGHPVVAVGGERAVGPVAAAPWGSASILTISYAYIALMGAGGLRRATSVAILNANYVAKRLEGHYEVVYRGREGFIAHECILDTRPLKAFGVEVEDIAKRLMDYGFHAPTMSFPVIGTLMVEPTESESKGELDRFCEAMIAIRNEARAIERGDVAIEESPLRHAPHTAVDLAGEWRHPYSRETAVFPAPWTREHKYWPPVSRVDNVTGDRTLICACPPIEAYTTGS
jgi:glycine dehydrogenase